MSFNFNSSGIQWNGSGGGGGEDVTVDGEQTLTNKTMSADSNTFTDFGVGNFKEGVVRDTIRPEDTATDWNLVTEKAVAQALATYVHIQASASDTWVIVHNLNRYPSVQVEDSAGNQFLAPIHYDSMNQLTVYMNGSTTGKAYLN